MLAAQFDARVLLTLEEACGAMGVSVRTGYGWMQTNSFPMPFHKQGNRIMIDIRDLAEYLDREREHGRVAYEKKKEQSEA